MHDQRIPATLAGDPDQLKQALLGLLVHDHPGLWSLAELDRSLTPSADLAPGAEPDRSLVEDAVGDLYAAGLLHRLGTYVCATRAAHEAQRLAG